MIHPNIHRIGSRHLFLESRDSFLVQGKNKQSETPMICEYSLRTKQWTEWNWKPFPFVLGAGLVCTKNGRYIISFEANGKIIVYDLNTRQIKKSSIRCPDTTQKKGFQAVNLGDKERDELTTFGFVNSSFKKKEFRGVQALPHYLISMIGKWYAMEYIHLIPVDEQTHWRIAVDQILSNL